MKKSLGLLGLWAKPQWRAIVLSDIHSEMSMISLEPLDTPITALIKQFFLPSGPWGQGKWGLISLAQCPQVPRNLSRTLSGIVNKWWLALWSPRKNLWLQMDASCQQFRGGFTCIYMDELGLIDLAQPRGKLNTSQWETPEAWAVGGLWSVLVLNCPLTGLVTRMPFPSTRFIVFHL